MNDFLKIPNLPAGRVTSVLVDYRISAESIQALQALGIEVYKTKRTPQLYDAVAGHPDMVIHHLGGNRFAAAPGFDAPMPPGVCITIGKSRLFEKYPADIAYNAARVGKYLIHNFKYTDPCILRDCERLFKINVNQGYSKCSVCVISDNAIITSDVGIAKKCDNFGIDALLCDDSDILLTGMSHGFIGGSTGLLSQKMLAVNGDIQAHRDCEKIQCFCEKYGVRILSLKKGAIEDIGSIIPLTEERTTIY